jgi:hypothetical protein
MIGREDYNRPKKQQREDVKANNSLCITPKNQLKTI